MTAPFIEFPIATAPLSDRMPAFTFGDGVSTQYDLAHNLGTRDVLVQVYELASFNDMFCQITRRDTNTVRLTFQYAVALNSVRCVVYGA